MLLLLLVGVSAGVSSAVQADDSGQVGRIVVAALVQTPAVWTVVAIVVLAFGFAPRQTYLGWVALTVFVLLGEFGPLFKLDQAVMDLSPFTHIPRMPGGHLTAPPLLWLTAIAGGLIAVGLGGFRRRDAG